MSVPIAYACRPEQLPESVGRDVSDADLVTSGRCRVASCLLLVPRSCRRRPLLLLLLLLTAML